MKAEYLKKIDRAIRRAGTRKPDDVLEEAGLVLINPGRTVDGFITVRKGIVFYGVSRNLRGRKYDFGVFHEGAHYWCLHLRLPGFIDRNGAHKDECGSFGLIRKIIAGTEREANIGAAHALIETDQILDMLGYDNADVIAYRKDMESFERTVKDYEYHISVAQHNGSPDSRVKRMIAYRRDLNRMYNELEEQARDLQYSGCCLSKYDISRENGVPEYIIDLKLEALSCLNYNVDTVELPTFDRVFHDWN